MSFTPSVNIQTNITTRLLSDANDGSAFIIGTAQWGKENEFLEYEGSSEIASMFKSGAIKDGANFFVLGGGRDLSVYRFTPNDAVKASGILQCSGVSEITLFGKYKGSYGNNISFIADAVDTTKRKLTITDGIAREIFDNNGSGYSTNAEIVTAIGSGISGNSNLVDAVQVGSGSLIGTYTSTQLTTGANGTAITISDVSTIINTYMDREYSFLLAPEITTDADHNVIGGLMETRADTYKEFSIACLGIPQEEAYATTYARTASNIQGRIIVLTPGTFRYNAVNYSGGYGACFYAGMFAKQQLGVSLTHANFALDKYVNYATNVLNYSPYQVENLISKGFTVINKIGNYIGVARAVTKITDVTNPLFEQVVLKEIDYIKTNLYNILNPFVGQPNSDQKREEIKGVVQTFMDRAITNKVINGYNTEVLLEAVDTVRVNLEVEPTYPINNIFVNLTI